MHAGQLSTWVIVADPSKTDMLVALVTVEGLLFAALSISATLAGGGTFGAKTLGPPWLLAVMSAVLLCLVAVGVFVSWIDLFGGGAWPRSIDRKIEAIGLLIAILAQPGIAVVIACGLVRG